MHLDTPQALVPLTAAVPLRLHEARRLRVRSVQGTLWLTVDGQNDDLVLPAGSSTVVSSRAPVWISPLGGPATVGLSDA